MFWTAVRAIERGVDARADAFPFVAQVLEPPLALRRDGIVDAFAAIHALAARLQRAAFLERMQHGVDDALTEADGLVGDEAHGLHDFVAVHFPAAQHAEHQEFGHACQEWRVRLRHAITIAPSRCTRQSDSGISYMTLSYRA